MNALSLSNKGAFDADRASNDILVDLVRLQQGSSKSELVVTLRQKEWPGQFTKRLNYRIRGASELDWRPGINFPSQARPETSHTTHWRVANIHRSLAADLRWRGGQSLDA